jgi:putative NADH-flavin reductase
MRITVFGATGRTGRYILAEGLRRDHQLTAFTRWPAALVGPSTLAAVARAAINPTLPSPIEAVVPGTAMGSGFELV